MINETYFKTYSTRRGGASSASQLSSQTSYKQEVLYMNGKLHKAMCTCPTGRGSTCEHICALVLGYNALYQGEEEGKARQQEAAPQPPLAPMQQQQQAEQVPLKNEQVPLKNEQVVKPRDGEARRIPSWMKNDDRSGSAKRNETKKDDAGKKRPLNAYMLYCKEHRRRVVDNHPNLKLGQVSKLLAEEWKSLSDEEKSKYKKMQQDGLVNQEDDDKAGGENNAEDDNHENVKKQEEEVGKKVQEVSVENKIHQQGKHVIKQELQMEAVKHASGANVDKDDMASDHDNNDDSTMSLISKLLGKSSNNNKKKSDDIEEGGNDKLNRSFENIFFKKKPRANSSQEVEGNETHGKQVKSNSLEMNQDNEKSAADIFLSTSRKRRREHLVEELRPMPIAQEEEPKPKKKQKEEANNQEQAIGEPIKKKVSLLAHLSSMGMNLKKS